MYLYAWGIFTTYMFVASRRPTAAVALVFLLLAITFFIIGIGSASPAGTTNATNGTINLGGWFGLATAVVAAYTSFAAVTNTTFGKAVLPVVRPRR
jgi:succinate-acetate transporter protein